MTENRIFWTVNLTKKVRKQREGLPVRMRTIFDYLLGQMEINGPIQREWTNFSELRGKKDTYHCHLKNGRPTYVAVWIVYKKEKIIEVIYVGTHEKAPY